MKNSEKEIASFIADWPNSSPECRAAFVELMACMLSLDGTAVEFHARPSVTYSLRAVHPNQTRPLYAMVDVIDDEPRWLSVCFYGEMVTDPDEWGEPVPGGLLGEDGLCFAAEEITENVVNYLKERISQAYASVIEDGLKNNGRVTSNL